MSGKFDWRTEDEEYWDELDTDPASDSHPYRRSRWIVTLVLILLFAGLGAIFMRTVNRRMDDNMQAMRDDIVSSHNLLQFAEAERDNELFYSLLSGRDSSWTTSQHELFQLRLLRDRAPFGLQVQQTGPLPKKEDKSYIINFSPDLLTAEVQTLLPYDTITSDGSTDTIILQEIALYRLGRERWLLSPPEKEFWGSESTRDGRRIRLIYPQRDAELADRLLSDLDRALEEICGALADINCPSDLHLDVIFSTDPASLVNSARPLGAISTDTGPTVILPAPTLIGIPQDDGGYQALLRGYEAQMATAIISHHVGYECCQQLPFYQALIDYQLGELGLKPWPVSGEDYARIVAERVHLQDVATLWQSDDPEDLYGPDGWRVFTMVDYLLDARPNSSPANLQRELVRRGSFYGWLNGIFAPETGHTNTSLLSHLMRGFWLRGYIQTLDTDGEDIVLPAEQDLFVSCTDSDSISQEDRVSTLYRYEVRNDTWHKVNDTPNSLWISPLPGDDAILQQEFGSGDGYWETFIRGQNQLVPLMPNSEDFVVSFGQTDPDFTGLTAFVFPPDSDEATITWFDLLDCREERGCAPRELPGIPIWSPDGAHALFSSNPNAQIDLLQIEMRSILFDRNAEHLPAPLFVGDRNTLLGSDLVSEVRDLTPVGTGHAPFWLDSGTIGYITDAANPIAQRNSRVVARSVDQNDPQTLFSLNDLMVAMERDIGAIRLFSIHYVVVHPDKPDQLYAVAFSSWDYQAHVLSVDRSTSEVRYLMSAGYLSNHSLGLSPVGRFIVLTGVAEGDPNTGDISALLQVYDLAQKEVFTFLSVSAEFPPFSSYDWSLDGDWLALLLDNNLVGFFSPEQEQLRIVETPPGRCNTPVWVNQ